MVAQTDTLAYCIVELPIASLYFNTLMSNLNARGYIRGRQTEWNEYLSELPPSQSSLGRNTNNDAIVFSTFQATNAYSPDQSATEVRTETLSDLYRLPFL